MAAWLIQGQRSAHMALRLANLHAFGVSCQIRELVLADTAQPLLQATAARAQRAVLPLVDRQSLIHLDRLLERADPFALGDHLLGTALPTQGEADTFDAGQLAAQFLGLGGQLQ